MLIEGKISAAVSNDFAMSQGWHLVRDAGFIVVVCRVKFDLKLSRPRISFHSWNFVFHSKFIRRSSTNVQLNFDLFFLNSATSQARCLVKVWTCQVMKEFRPRYIAKPSLRV